MSTARKFLSLTGKSIADRLTVSVAALAGIAIAGGAASGLVATMGLNAASTALQQSEVETKNVLKLSAAVKAAELEVVQVQQFLTDLSATRGLDGLDDGAAKAEEAATAFYTEIDKSVAIAKELGAAEMVATLEAARAAFPAYYSVGKRMTAAYVARGPEAGNPMMADFDGKAEKIHDAVASSLTALDAIEATADQNRQAVIAEAAQAR
ncbi:MAG: hypothetical protein EBZ50_09310, partial [Alphaproteobacteria bacterium]|nr:hypothetical protein [Alphaproteobacteria bacterium]